MEVWKRKALKFILNQRKVELENSIRRYPDSPRYDLRCDELNKINTQLADIEAEE